MKTTVDITIMRIDYGIQISVGENETFMSCSRGGDLNDLDEMLLTFLPEINLVHITCTKARNLEKKLYRMLSECKQRRTMKKAFLKFLDHVEKQYCKRPSAITKKIEARTHSIKEVSIDAICPMNIPALLSSELTRCLAKDAHPI